MDKSGILNHQIINHSFGASQVRFRKTESGYHIPRKLYADKPAAVIELKYDKSAQGAIAQIKEKNYCDALKDYHGNLRLCGINYDRETKTHSCIIEKVERK